MTDIVALDRPLDAFAEQAPPATRVRGYWQSVFYRLRHDPVTLVFAAHDTEHTNAIVLRDLLLHKIQVRAGLEVGKAVA